MNILALDQATKTGWACDFQHGSGVWDLRIKKDESAGMRLIRLRSKLKELQMLMGFDLLVYERVAGRFQSSTNVASEIVSVMKVFCEDNGIEYRAFSAGEIKRHATGKGNCGKPAMIAAAKKKWPHIEIEDDNQADALHLLSLAREEYGN